MWKQPSPDFNLSSATWGLRVPFSVHWRFGLNTECTPIESFKILSQEAQEGHEVGTWGCGWEGWEGWGKDSEMCSWEIWISL